MVFTKLLNGRLTNLDDIPLDERDAVNQNYVDGQSQKSSVKAATTSNVTFTTSVIDGMTINETERVLLKDQTIPSENGIYIMVLGTLVRANGAETTDTAAGCSVFVTDGVVNDDTQWQCTDTYGTLFGSNIIFEQVQSGGGGGGLPPGDLNGQFLQSEGSGVFSWSNPKRVLLQSSIENLTKSGFVVKYAEWGLGSKADIDNIVIGISGKIIRMVATYSGEEEIDINDASEKLSFSIGTPDNTLTTFTPFIGGSGVVEFNNTHNNTYPVVSSGPINIPFLDTDRIAIRSIETGSVNPTNMTVNFSLIIQLD